MSLGTYAQEVNSNYVTVNVSRHQVKINHNEVSSAPGYFSMAEQSQISLIGIQVGLEKEFFADKFLSFTAGGGAGVLLGKDKDDHVKTDLMYKDKASGFLYNANGSINANYSMKSTRIQFFGGASILKTKAKYRVAYSHLNVKDPGINIDYSEDGTQSFVRAGVRVFHAKEELFSTFALEYKLASTFTTTTSASKLNLANIAISNSAEAEHSPLGIVIGFGLMF